MVIKYKKKWLIKEKPRTVMRYSRTRPWTTTTELVENTPYVVSLTEENKWMCSCPQWKFRRITCKHITMILHKFGYLNMRNWDHPNLDSYIFEEIDPAITGTIAEIARIIGKMDKEQSKD